MNKEELEKICLEKLSKGLLDGIVGSDFETGDYAKVTIRKIIKDGIPQTLKFGADSKFFDNKENVHIAGKVTKKLFESNEDKIIFLRKFGFLIKDADVQAYSALFKGEKL